MTWVSAMRPRVSPAPFASQAMYPVLHDWLTSMALGYVAIHGTLRLCRRIGIQQVH